MAVPKKKKSYTKTLIKYNSWKNKKIKYQNFWTCSNCFSLNKSLLSCNFCSSHFASWKKN